AAAPPSSQLFPYTSLFRSVVEYAVSQIPRDKIFLGQNLYGYDWSAPFGQADSKPAVALSPRMATNLAINEKVSIEYDAVAQAPQDRKSTRLNSSHVKISYA